MAEAPGDSEWCRRERAALADLRKKIGDFNYVFARLDAEPLPLFARGDISIDFEGSTDGPTGGS